MTADQIAQRVLFDATQGYSFVKTIHESNHPRHLNLIITADGSEHRLKVQTLDPKLQAALGDNVECRLPLTENQLWGAVQECRETWHEQVIDRLSDYDQLVFQRYWDISSAPQHLASALRPLAEAGAKLFLAIFLPSYDDGSPDVTVRRHIFNVLRQHTAGGQLWIRVTSSRFFAPWNMIYCRRTDGPIDPTGFWGYQHVIEHVPHHGGVAPIDLDQPVEEPLQLGVNIDPGIDTDLDVLCLRPVLDQFAIYQVDGLRALQRACKQELASALRSGVMDHVLYFCCHAEQEGDSAVIVGRPGRLRLGDEDWITPSDIALWIDDGNLAKRPVIFLNACASGQFNSAFYQGFGLRFLAKGACSVIGPQTDLPAVFGGEFARRFFARFFAGGQPNNIGAVLADLRRSFFDEYRNPLGLLYSLYRGGDTFLARPVPENAT